MADCTGLITANFVLDCDYLPIAGLTTNALLINFDDIDRTATTISGSNRLLMTNLQLKAGKTAYLFTGVKQTNSKNYTLVPKDNNVDKYTHGFTGTVFNPSVENKLQVANLSLGGKYVVIVEQLWKGEDNEDAFEVLGYFTGLKLNEATNNSNENDNTIALVLGSEEGFEEPSLPHNLLETDYATTKTAFDNQFAQASV
jgi:hypothetical protein